MAEVKRGGGRPYSMKVTVSQRPRWDTSSEQVDDEIEIVCSQSGAFPGHCGPEPYGFPARIKLSPNDVLQLIADLSARLKSRFQSAEQPVAQDGHSVA
jgi:hypothetical protein